MKPFGLTLAILNALMALLATTPIARAQTVYGDVAGGLNLGYARNATNPTVQASIGVRISRRFEVRAEWLSASRLSDVDHATCGPGVPWQACNPATGVRGWVGSGILNLNTPARGPRLYLIGGAGYYRFRYHQNYDETALGVSGGVGFAVLAGERLRFGIEARRHYMLDARYWLPDLLPVVFRFQF